MTKYQLSGPGPKIKIATVTGNDAAKACGGGSANCDRVVIHFPSVREAAVAGLPGYLQQRSGWHRRGLHLDKTFGGIGNRRAVGVQAMQKSLKTQDVDCDMYYQID